MQMLDWWGPVIWETYGGMEGAATIAKPHRWLEKPGTVGRTVKGMSVKILDAEGNELGPNELGDVYLEPERGGDFAYKDDPELTASVSAASIHPRRHWLPRRGRLPLHLRPRQGHDHQWRSEHLSGRDRGRAADHPRSLMSR